jgi:hypothetical protein
MKLDFRAIPLWLIKEYLIELGATELSSVAPEKTVLVADGWQAVVSKGEPFKVGSLQVGVTEVEFSGEATNVEAILEKLQRKTLRVGG